MLIRKAKVIKGETLEVQLIKPGPDAQKFTATEEHPSIVHPDLLQAFANMRLHFALLVGYIPFKSVSDKQIQNPPEDLVEDYTVTGISIKDGDNEGFVLTGQKKLSNGKVVTINSPFTRFDESEETGYKFISDLEEKLDRATLEVEEYLKGKFASDPQQQLPFDTAEVVSSEINRGDDEVWKEGERPQLGTK